MADWKNFEIDEIPSWSRKAQLVLLFAGFILSFSFISFFVLLPIQSEIEQKEANEDKLKNNLMLIVRQVNQMKNVNEQLSLMQKAYQKVQKIFPAKDELAELLASVDDLTKKNNLLIRRMDWLESKENQDLHIHPLKIDLQGSYADFGLFSENLAKLLQMISLQKVVVESSALHQTSHELKFSIVANTYSFSPSNVD